MDVIKVLAINPGSTSTKIALFENYDNVFSMRVDHAAEDLKRFKEVNEQLEYRSDMVEKAIAGHGFSFADIDVFVGRGGGLMPLEGGTYEVNDLLVSHASSGMAGQHPAQLGSQIARRFADMFGKRAYVVNPPAVDELCDVARVTGVRGLYRESHIHALNQKEVAIRFCREHGMTYGGSNLIICHLGGGISVTAHEKGRMVDSNDIIRGSGPLSPTRAGDLPYMKLLEMAFSGKYTQKELVDKLNMRGGLTDHFGTSDARDVVKLIEEGDEYAKIVMDGMIYQIAKYAGSMAVAMKGNVDAIILTGGMANREYVTSKISEYVDWIAAVTVMPGEFELEALAAGALRAALGEEETRIYTGVPVWGGFRGMET